MLTLQQGRLGDDDVGKGVTGMLQNIEIVQQHVRIADDNAHLLPITASAGR